MRFVLKRLALFVVALFGLSVVVFAALRILPGDVASVMAGVNSPPERVTQLREQLGLNRPLIAQYFDWMSALARGDFGTSILTGRSVTSLVGARASITFPLIILGLLIALAIGLPLGWATHRYAAVGRAMFPVLNIIQTIPSIALFGLLMAPLAWLATAVPSLGRAGISGVGLAPGVLALTLYSLLPVVRGTLAGLAQVPSAVTQAAQGLGFSSAQLFWQAEVPLALPVVLGGIRTASIQAVGLAAVTALIGAGGLGSLMFEGLFSSAQDLVLLGVVPIVLMGALVDGAFKVLIRLTRPVTAHREVTL